MALRWLVFPPRYWSVPLQDTEEAFFHTSPFVHQGIKKVEAQPWQEGAGGSFCRVGLMWEQGGLWGAPALPTRKSPNLKEQKLAPDGKSSHSSTSPVPTFSCVLAGSLATHTLPQADRAQALNQGGLNHHKPSQCLAPAAGGNLLPQPPQPEAGELWYCLHLFFFFFLEKAAPASASTRLPLASPTNLFNELNPKSLSRKQQEVLPGFPRSSSITQGLQ